MKKNDIFPAEITGMTSEGAGVCRVEGTVVFVPGAAPGDRLRVRILKTARTHAFGRVEEVLSPGPGRQEPDCLLCCHELRAGRRSGRREVL